jgi:hypothetical protein
MPCRLLALALLPLLAAPVAAQAPRVTAVTPAPEAIGVPVDATIDVTFDEPVLTSTVTDTSFRVFGRWSGPHDGTFTFSPEGDAVRFEPTAPFFPGEAVLVQLARTITAEDGTPLDHGYAWTFWTWSAPHVLDYTEDYRISLRRTGEGQITVYGAYGGDLDSDGDSDLITSQESTDDARVLLNDGAGNFSDFTVHPLAGGAVPSPLDGADFDHDGRLDVAIGNTQNDKVHVLVGDGTGGFTSITPYATAGSSTRAVALADFDGDGHDDIVTASRTNGLLTLLRGRGDGTFDPAESFNGGGSGETALAAADANGDGILDLFVGDIQGGVSACLGDGDGGFTCGPQAGDGAAWMIAAGDLDNDGDPDVAVAASSSNGVEALYSDGEGGFERTEFHPRGSFAIAIDMADLDGDGDLDVLSSNYGSGDFSLFENDGGDLVFRQQLDAQIAGSCGTLHDRDGDGGLEITGIDEVADLAIFFSSEPFVANEPGAPGDALALTVLENPSRGPAALRLHVPALGPVRLRVFDALGREVAALLDGALPAGERTVRWDARGLPAGGYLARLEAGGEVVTARLTLVR